MREVENRVSEASSEQGGTTRGNQVADAKSRFSETSGADDIAGPCKECYEYPDECCEDD